MKKYLRVNDNDKLYIFNSKSNNVLEIYLKDNVFKTKITNNLVDNENLIIRSVREDELHSFYLLDSYLATCGLNTPESVRKLQSKLIDYHYDFLYKDKPKNKIIKNYDFQVIINLEDDFK